MPRRPVRTPLIDRPRPARDGQLRCAETGMRAQDLVRYYIQRCVLPIHEGPCRFEWFEEEVVE